MALEKPVFRHTLLHSKAALVGRRGHAALAPYLLNSCLTFLLGYSEAPSWTAPLATCAVVREIIHLDNPVLR
eukprot:scaffold145590_cov23-Tisochrysis_lutea.AAC.3